MRRVATFQAPELDGNLQVIDGNGKGSYGQRFRSRHREELRISGPATSGSQYPEMATDLNLDSMAIERCFERLPGLHVFDRVVQVFGPLD